jgi:hypothetical protein
MSDRRERVLVLGAGLQGVCVALCLAQRGFAVCLIDRARRCLDRASYRNEGKIHLGLVYAKDPVFRTAELMLESALSFAPLLDRWTDGRIPWDELRSTPFHYIVARDTLMPVDVLFAHYARVEDKCHDLQRASSGLHYLGHRIDRLWSPCVVPPQVSPAFAVAAASTVEVSIHLTRLREFLVESVECLPHIELRCGHEVKEVSRTSSGFAVSGINRNGARWRRDGDCVVNALWDGRLAIDAQMGLHPDQPWVYRFKHRLCGRMPHRLDGLPSMTIVLGPYGDVVTRADGDSLYLSWYPVCMTGWSRSLKPPRSWTSDAAGAAGESERESIKHATLAAFDAIVPGLADMRTVVVDGGVIFSWGSSDIDDPASKLHRRDQIGVLGADGYYSINTGKLTCAPYFARRLSDLLP